MSLGLLPRLQSWRFHYGLDMLVAAYRRAADGPEADKMRAEASLKDWVASPSYQEHPDPQGYSDHLAGLHEEAEVALRLIREAFVISLFHFWERQAKAWTHSGSNYHHDDVIKMLTQQGFTPEADQLRLLQLVANVAKHSAGRSAQELYEVRENLFRDPRRVLAPQIRLSDDAPYEPNYDDLLVPGALLQAFFDAVRKSGPPRAPLRF